MRRIIAGATLAGFLAGAFCTALLVWRFGNFVGTHNPAVDAAHRPAVERWIDGLDEEDGGGGIIEGRPAQPVQVEDPREPEVAIRPAEPPPAPAGTSGNDANLPAALLDRRLEVPVQGIGRAELVQSFDAERGRRRHQAIDILAPRNTPVLAVEDGRIARLFRSVPGGLTIYQYDPTERYVYYYAHLERYAAGLSEGDRVGRGQVIGYVGTTGNAPENTPHLHFAIFQMNEPKRWWEGTALDPYEILRKGG